MEYQVPQFIEIEDKIFGPLTLKQFIYLAGGIGLAVVAYLYLPHAVGFPLAFIAAAAGAAFAFYRINEKPLIEIAEAAFNYLVGGRLYLWKQEEQKTQSPVARPIAPTPEVREQLGLSRGRLRELAWSLDVKDQGQ
jgi:hypothetical protein